MAQAKDRTKPQSSDMGMTLLRWLIALLVIFVVTRVDAVQPMQELRGRVVGVSDGDTITLLINGDQTEKIRLSGIDAPEKSQAFGQRSKQSLSDLVYDREVTVQWRKRDKYKRIVGKVILDGRDINLEQVRRGMTWHYKAYEREQPRSERLAYAEAEGQARSAQQGLWVDMAPVPPWGFRRAEIPKRKGEAGTSVEIGL